MGGGDLNLKKSWHPSTLRNIERVWKAEQKHEVEKQKIEQLQKELAEERAKEEIQAYAEDQGVVKKREERLDWMYQGPAAMVNREDYLLGRKVDKTLALLEQEESGVAPKNDDFDIGSTMFSSQDLSGTATVDLANKIREDPLFSIMKKEKEERKNLLCNPVKMKQLQQMLQKSLGKDKKKSRKSHSDSDRKHHKKHKREKHSSHSSEEETMTQKSRDHHKKSKKFSSHEDRPERYYERESRSNKYHTSVFSNRDKDHYQSSRYASMHSSREASQAHFSKQNSEDRNKRKIDEEERERRLREMQENAKWREEQRARKVRRYREEDEKEEKTNKIDTSDFIKPMLSKAAGKGSVESRVKQKIFSIQRGYGDMDKHFARR